MKMTLAAKEFLIAGLTFRRIIFIDECQFSSNTLLLHDWAKQFENVSIEQSKQMWKFFALIWVFQLNWSINNSFLHEKISIRINNVSAGVLNHIKVQE